MFCKDGEAALERNGGETKAPKNSYGCKHCAMKDMRRVSVSDFNCYLNEGEALHDQMCSDKNCPHGLTGRHWHIKNYVGTNGKHTGANLVALIYAVPIIAWNVVKKD